jgi:hypothetical protein
MTDRNNSRRWPMGLIVAAAAAFGFLVGAWQAAPRGVVAQSPPPKPTPAQPPASDYGQRVVAYIYGSVPITREMLGEYLIARYGAEKVELLVNKMMIEHVCKQKNVTVTPEEVDATIDADLGVMNVKKADFMRQVLKQYGKSLYEWKEDVIRPRLLLTKLVKEQIKVTDEELRKAFDAQFGEKVQVRLIMWPPGEEKLALKMYDAIRSSEAEFDRAARGQANPNLAASGGRVNPMGHGAGESDLLEKTAFKLRAGEVSELLTIPGQGTLVMKCDGRVPPDASKRFETERDRLYKLVFDRKVFAAIPQYVQKLKEEAKPTIILKYGTTDQDVIRAAEQELKYQNGNAVGPTVQPAGATGGPSKPVPAPPVPGGN